jgi:hypothetical protein
MKIPTTTMEEFISTLSFPPTPQKHLTGFSKLYLTVGEYLFPHILPSRINAPIDVPIAVTENISVDL